MQEEYGVLDKRIAFLGNLSHKKGVEMLIHSFQTVYKHDPEYTLHIGGKIQDSRYAVYLDHIIPELGLSEAIHYHGHIEKPLEWLENFSFILVTSPLEGCPVGALEALSVGLTPLFYSFVGAKGLYPPDFIWSTFDELIELIKKGPQDPQKYKNFVKNNYSREIQFEKLDKIVENLLKDTEKQPEIEKNSTVSAIIAVKNGEKTIRRTIESLQNQTKPLDKIIIVNDSSTDDTLKIVQVVSSESNIPMEVVSLEPSKWVFSARNEGFKRIDSDYFFFLDADDWVSPTYVEKMSKVFDENSAIDVVYPDMIYFDGKGREKIFNQPEFSSQTLAQYNFIAYSSMQRTASFKKIGGFSDYMNDCRNHLTEWALWLKYVQNGHGFKRLAQPLFHYFHDELADQMSMGYERSRNDMSLELALQISNDHSEIQMTGEKKRIVLVCQGKDYCDRSQVGFELFTWYKPLEEFGDVFVFQYDVEVKHFGVQEMQERLKKFIDLIQPDYVFHPTYRTDILSETWNEISKKYCTICWNSDDDRRYHSFTKEYARCFRYSVTTYPSIYDLMEHHGRLLSSWAANQYYFKPIVDTKLLCSNMPAEKTTDITFVGQKYGDREDMLNGIQGVLIYGLGWNNGFISYPKMAEIIASSKISISFSKGADGNKQIKLRPFEICACNTLCLCEYTEGIEKFYEIDKEIVVFNDKAELVHKLEYYLANDAIRKEIAQNGYDRTMREHLWKHRFSKIFKEIK